MNIKDKKTNKLYKGIKFDGNNYNEVIAILNANGVIEFGFSGKELTLFNSKAEKYIYDAKNKYIVNKSKDNIEVLSDKEFNDTYTVQL